MEENKSYFSEVVHGIKTLCIGMKTTLKEYFIPKSTEQYPENRKTTLHIAKRHRGRLVFKRDENGNYKCTACTLCEKACPNGSIKIVSQMVEDPETGKKVYRYIHWGRIIENKFIPGKEYFLADPAERSKLIYSSL